ncbi:agamous-like MADS-box protein AGL80 [Papaver somniferum]|uniref:agamous-like MADS-box protein AGL80 n=1 Tax=Papaver somniferum TaxID=3469 RepID=UPI000E6FD8FD|nr:agamous-like MADS-box protein AGL80 [Papaver somniferum]
MARMKKVAYIPNSAARRATFRKRRMDLLKKVSEISNLCDVDACAIVYEPDNPQPKVWPARPEAHRVLMRFKSLPEGDQLENDQESSAENQMGMTTENSINQQLENHYVELCRMFNRALDGESSIPEPDIHPVDLIDFAWLLDEKHKEVQQKLLNLQKANATSASEANTIAIPNPSYSVDTNVNVGVLDENHVSGINGGTVADGAMYGGVVNHHDQGGRVMIDGIGDQEIRMAAAAMEALQIQPLFMDANNLPSVSQSDDQMVDYLEGYLNNNQMMQG